MIIKVLNLWTPNMEINQKSTETFFLVTLLRIKRDSLSTLCQNFCPCFPPPTNPPFFLPYLFQITSYTQMYPQEVFPRIPLLSHRSNYHVISHSSNSSAAAIFVYSLYKQDHTGGPTSLLFNVSRRRFARVKQPGCEAGH
jgi:hypothetical protein